MTIDLPVACVAQVLDNEGEVAGAGFLIADDVIVTCAHVVHAAGQGPGKSVQLAFPHLEGAPRRRGVVLADAWRAPEASDIAVLRVDRMPSDARVAALASAAGCRGHQVRAFGFPGQAPPGGHFGYGTAGDLLPATADAGVVLQLTGANDVTTGFSGGPVLDEVTGRVIGMVTAISSPDTHLKGLGIAYATPVEALREAWPELAIASVSPYRELKPFTSQDAAWFHGRQEAVDRVVAHLGARRRVLLLGPSGAGKSSLVQAGVLPALSGGRLPDSDRWLPLLVHPGQDLAESLERAGLPGVRVHGLASAVDRKLASEHTHQQLLLVIDQFEELLTRCVTRDVVGLLDQLVRVSSLRLILVMRNDFYPRLAALAPAFLEAIASDLLNVPASLSEGELHAIITRPARSAGGRFEDGLPERIITDVLAADPAGAVTRHASVTLLAPLELTLSRLWDRQHDGYLTHSAYHRLGEVSGALAAWCAAALDQMPAGHQPTAHRILTALVRPADDVHDIPAVRRRLTLTTLRELAADTPGASASDTTIDNVLDVLVRHRIITTSTLTEPDGRPSEATAELIHDALIRDWGDLRNWVAQDHRFQDWLRRAEEQQARWTANERPGDLLDGTDLVDGLTWARQRRLPSALADFVALSHDWQQSDLRRSRRRTRVLAVTSALLFLALVAGAAFAYQAAQQRRTAVAAQHTAESRQLAAQSAEAISTNPDLASLLAVQAYRTSHTAEATAGLQTAAALPLRRRLTSPDNSGPIVALSPDGQTLATGDYEGVVRLWNVATGRVKSVLRGHSDWITSLSFSLNGKTLASSSRDGTVRLWNARSGTPKRTITAEAGRLQAVAFSPDDHTLAVAGDETVLFDADTGTARAPLKGPSGIGQAVAFSPDGRTLATASDDHTVLLWDVASRAKRTALTGHTADVTSVAFSPDGHTVATASHDGSIRLWDASNGHLRRRLTGSGGFAWAVAFSPDGRTLVTADNGYAVRLWNPATGELQATFLGHDSPVWSVAFSTDGTTLATGDEAGGVRLWDAATGRTRLVINGGSPMFWTGFTRSGQTLVTAGNQKNVQVRDSATGRVTYSLASSSYIQAAALSPDGHTLAVGDADDRVRLWSITAGKARALPGFEGPSLLDSLAFSPDGRTLAVTGGDAQVHLRDLTNGTTRTIGTKTAGPDSSFLNAVSFPVYSPDGHVLATAGTDGTASLWNAATGALLDVVTVQSAPMGGLPYGVNSLAFSPDGHLLAMASGDGTTRLWDVLRHKTVAVLSGHRDSVDTVAFSPDGRGLATGGADGTVRLWDTKTGKRRAVLSGHTEDVKWVAFSPDGGTLASASTDGTIRLWTVALPDQEQAIRHICRAVRRDLTPKERKTYLPGQPSHPTCP